MVGPLSRRRFVQQAAAVSALAALPAARLAAQVRFSSYPFKLGVASGEPAADGFVLWTRLAPEPFEPEQLGQLVFELDWEVAEDTAFNRVVARGTASAAPHLAHSVHVEVQGLAPASEYFYRFRLGRYESQTGRAVTAPAAGSTPGSLRLATCSCAHYEQGFFASYHYMAEDRPDLIIELGDYIYESGYGEHRVRLFDKRDAKTLTDYRHRYAQYKLDPDLQAAHAACPWLLTWDDHEVDNDYAGLTGEQEACGGDNVRRSFPARRAAAYQAWYENLPVRPSRLRPAGGIELYGAFEWGDLATIYLLDTRQYRSPQACPRPATIEHCDAERGSKILKTGAGGGRLIPASDPACKAELDDPARTMLGEAQERWFDQRLGGAHAAWNLVAQGTPFATIIEGSTRAPQVYSDGWGGYPAAQRRLLQALARHKVGNPVIFSGDLHAFFVNDVPAGDGHTAAVEFVVTSAANNNTDKSQVLGLNPQIRYHEGTHSGYLRCELTPSTLRADLVAIDDMHDPRTPRQVLASFAVDAGKPGVRRLS